jgi:hypothetical protein
MSEWLPVGCRHRYPEYTGREREQARRDLQMVAEEVRMEILGGHCLAVDQDPKHMN